MCVGVVRGCPVMAMTIGAVTMAMVEMRRGNKRAMQQMLRYRVAFQGVTVLAVVYGGYQYRNQHPELGPVSDKVLATVRNEAPRYQVQQSERGEQGHWQDRLAELEAQAENQEERQRQNRELVMAQLIAQDQARSASKRSFVRSDAGSSSGSSSGSAAAGAAGSDQGEGQGKVDNKDGAFVSSFTNLFGTQKQE